MDLALETLSACPLCAGQPDGEYTYGKENQFTYCHCSVCGVMYLNPRMTDAQTDEYYRGYYRQVCPVNDADRWIQFLRAANIMRLFRGKLVGSAMLEIGCSAGCLIREFAGRGYTCTGVDPEAYITDERASLYSSLADIPPTPFDMICLVHTLEHFNHPLEIVTRLVKDYSHPGARFIIEVPNSSPSGGVIKIHHPLGFNKSSLRYLFGMVGARPVVELVHGLTEHHPNFLLAMFEVQ